MGNTIHLTLTGRQRDDSGEEIVTKIQTKAESYEKNGSLYILYEETEDGTVTRNTIKFKDSVLELTKRGSINSHMVFRPGTEQTADYATPYGCIKMAIATRAVKETSLPGHRKILAEYTLSSNGAPLCECSLTLLASDTVPDNSLSKLLQNMEIP